MARLAVFNLINDLTVTWREKKGRAFAEVWKFPLDRENGEPRRMTCKGLDIQIR